MPELKARLAHGVYELQTVLDVGQSFVRVRVADCLAHLDKGPALEVGVIRGVSQGERFLEDGLPRSRARHRRGIRGIDVENLWLVQGDRPRLPRSTFTLRRWPSVPLRDRRPAGGSR